MMRILLGKVWGRKKPHPHSQIQNENGVYNLD